ncbi:rCG34654 [Rattus norvegicus]|uniref:RCG34654 n=1 Tax=Rattus norvegicus TaxID=10116 RepID=A6HDI6_RAT|nr:rCG34654 [Rattus norvegicus]
MKNDHTPLVNLLWPLGL